MSDDKYRIEAFDLKPGAANFQTEMWRQDPEIAFHLTTNSRTLETILAVRHGPGPEDFEHFILKPNTLKAIADGLRQAADYVKAKQAERGTK